MSQNICKRCLLRDMDEAGTYDNLKNYMARVEPNRRTSNEEYERRLGICQKCDFLLSGMCRKCGCFVELRGLIAANCCPDVPRRW